MGWKEVLVVQKHSKTRLILSTFLYSKENNNLSSLNQGFKTGESEAKLTLLNFIIYKQYKLRSHQTMFGPYVQVTALDQNENT